MGQASLVLDRRAHLTDRALYRRVYEVDLLPGQYAIMPWDEPRLLWALRFLRPADSVIDIGCHKGEMTRYIAFACDGRCLGVDISISAINACRHIYRGLPMRWLVADAAALPVSDNSFDVAVLAEILEHVPDPAAVIAEAERVVRPGGRVIVSVPKEAVAMDKVGQAKAEARGALPFDSHVREFIPAVEFQSKAKLQLSEGSLSDGLSWRLAAYEVRK